MDPLADPSGRASRDAAGSTGAGLDRDRDSDVISDGYPTRGYDGFRGRVSEYSSDSVPWWPPENRAAEGSPNVVVILVDDLGFSDVSPFGSEIRTPAIQELADEGYRFTNYHSTPLCSPTRAALMTGLNPHRAGFASVAHFDPGFPGYQLEIADDVPTLAESFRAGGYATFMVGKWHLTKESKMHDAADKSSWPVQRGFDHYYGSMDGFTSLFHPHRLVCDNTAVRIDEFPPDYYLTDDLTDRAIGMIDELRASDPAKPFFLYFAHQAVHGPVQAKRADIEKYRGAYDAGWDRIRHDRFRRQLEDGIFPEGTRASESGPDRTLGVLPWDELTDEQRALFARHMEAYAGAVDGVDQSVAALISHLKDLGEYENTIFVFASDNGASGEGGTEGTRSYFSQFVHLAGLPEDWCADVPRELDLIGGPRVQGHYPRGWAHVSNTPFRYYKGQTYAGGVHTPLIVSWPGGLGRRADDDGIRDQYAYVTDVGPTLLSLAGVERLSALRGKATKELDGVSFAKVLRDRGARSDHRSQYVECGGQRGYFEDGLKIIAPHLPGAPFGEGAWELYDITVDPAETRDLAAERPERVTQLAESWRRAAWLNTVFPLDDTGTLLAVRPASELRLSAPVTLYPTTPPLERYRSSKLTHLRSFRVDAALELRPGDQGVLVAHGDQGGGYAIYLEDGRLCLSYNAYGHLTRECAPLPGEGERLISAQFTALPEMQWRIELCVDGSPVILLERVPQLLGMAPFTGISVGVDAGGPVDWELSLRHGAFRYRGRLHWVRYVPGEAASYNPEIIAEIEAVSAGLLE